MFIICLLLTYALFSSLLHSAEPNAQTALAYLGLFALATGLICVRQKRFPPRAIPCGLACLALCLSFVLHDDGELHLMLFLLLIPLSGIYCLTLTGANLHPFGSFYVLLDLLRCEFLLPLRNLFAPLSDAIDHARQRRVARQKTKKHRKWVPVVVGLLAAIPVLLVVIPLLIDADAAFESVMGGLYQHIRDALHSFGDWLEQVLPFNGFALVLSLLFAPYIYAVIHTFATGRAKRENSDIAPRYRSLQKVPPAFPATVLGSVSAVYLIYILTQIGYLFSAFSGRLPFGVSISVTEYARRGFFEMCELAGVNFMLLALSVGVAKRKNGRIAPLIKGFDVFLCLFTMLLCAVSVAKILLYIRTFGLTEKRLYVFAADIVLLVVFLAILLRLRFERFPYMKVMLCALFSAAAVLGLCGVGNTIAWYNTNGLLSGNLQEMSVDEIRSQNPSAALPYLERIAASDSEYAADARLVLREDVTYDFLLTQAEPFQNMERARYLRHIAQRIREADCFQIKLKLETQTPVYGLGYACLLNGKVVLSGGMEHADETPLSKYETISIEREMLPENADLSALELRFSAYLSPDDTQLKEIHVINKETSSFDTLFWGCVREVQLIEQKDGIFYIM